MVTQLVKDFYRLIEFLQAYCSWLV